MTQREAEIKRETFQKPIEKIVFRVLMDSVKATIDSADILNEESVNAIKKEPIEDMYIKIYQVVGLDFAKESESDLIKDLTVDDITLANIQEWVKVNAGARITEVWLYSKEQYVNVVREAITIGIESGLGPDAVARSIRNMVIDRMGEISLVRAERIARTEIVSSSNMGSLQGAMNSQATVKKKWLTSGLPGTRITHLDAESMPAIDLNQAFRVGNDNLQYPGDPSGSAEETINCRCTIIYERL